MSNSLCRGCRQRPPRQPNRPGGSFYCNECFSKSEDRRRVKARKRSSDWQRINRERHNIYMKKYRAKHPEKHHARERKYQYGITEEQFRSMVKTQAGRCAICKKKCLIDEGPPQKRICVDHDHVTRKTRGLLCRLCNTAIGSLHDRPDLAEAMASYLRQHVVNK